MEENTKYKNTLNMHSNEDIKNNYIQEKYENKEKLRKRAINKILMKRAVVYVEEITNEKLEELEKLDYDKQFEIIKSYLSSNDKPDIIKIKILSYITKVICPFPAENKIKLKMLDKNILQDIQNIFYSTNNKDIFSACSSILSTFCTDYALFSTTIINEEPIKKIYNELKNKYFNNPFIIANCINCFKEGLKHLYEQINSPDIYDSKNKNLKDISYNSKRLLCNFSNWLLNNSEIFFSIPILGLESFFKLLELLVTTASVPNNYEMDFDSNNSNNSQFENILLFILKIKLKEVEYETIECYLNFLISLSNNEKYFNILTQYHNKICIFDVIKKLCGFIFLNNKSTQEDRYNYPPLDPDLLILCLKLLINLFKETVNHDDMMNLIFKFFNNYRGTVRNNQIVPIGIMEFILKLSENINYKESIYNFIFDPKNNIINDCIKFYTRNNDCYLLVLEFLVNIFEFKNIKEIENVDINKIIKCFGDALEISDKNINNKSIKCLVKIIEINIKKSYKIDLILKFEENHIVEKLNLLILNKSLDNWQEKMAEEIISYIEGKIKEEEK